VRLEVDILGSEPGTSTPPAAPVRDDTRRVVIVVSADGDVRRYIRESLRDRMDIRVLEVATVRDARRVGWHTRANLVITDVPEARGLAALRPVPAILITDDSSDGVPPAAECVALPRPFTAERLAAVVARLLG
jgi:DNA-binding NtrC family response regulator